MNFWYILLGLLLRADGESFDANPDAKIKSVMAPGPDGDSSITDVPTPPEEYLPVTSEHYFYDTESLIHRADGGKFDGNPDAEIISLVAPGLDADSSITDVSIQPEEYIPAASEFNFYKTESSEVFNSLLMACRQCMVAGDMVCVNAICRFHAYGKPNEPKSRDIHQKAFITGTSMYGDILCSLCKNTHDVLCTMKMCVDPERGRNALADGVQCMNGFCRWQKETAVSKGFESSYKPWWQPQKLYSFFDHVTSEILNAYIDLYSETSKAVTDRLDNVVHKSAKG